MPALPPPAPRPFFRRPWVVESLVFFGVLWQESLRLEWRTAHRVLPLPPNVTAFYYYQAGDFANGYVNAFLLDGLTDLARHWAARRRGGSVERQGLQAMLATVLSIVSIVLIELVPSAVNHPDVGDIPAGVVGALLYLCVRTAALR
jgi:hypothetical protein